MQKSPSNSTMKIESSAELTFTVRRSNFGPKEASSKGESVARVAVMDALSYLNSPIDRRPFKVKVSPTARVRMA